MSDKFQTISADDWRRSIRESRARPNAVSAQIKAELALREVYDAARHSLRLYEAGVNMSEWEYESAMQAARERLQVACNVARSVINK